ncbi:MAG: hypothetical protein ACRC5F_02990 [Cetobacterium sp.]
MKINDEELKELISELIDFIDKKVLEKEKTTKGAGNLKYKVYTNSKNEYFYNEYLVKGSIGHGNLSSDVGIAFLLGNNKITNGIYIYLTYNYNKQEIYLTLGSSHQSSDVIDLEVKNLFNEKYAVNYCKKFNYFEIVSTVNRLLNIFKQNFESV